MATSQFFNAHSSSYHSQFLQEIFRSRKRNGVMKVSINKAKLSESNVKKAHISATKRERIKLPNYGGDGENNKIYHMSDVLSHPSGIEAILNTRVLQSCQPLDSNLYRCILPQIQLLNFEVAPILDLQVTPTYQDCVVEMISCKFEGSEVVERDRMSTFQLTRFTFAASMRNRIKWEIVDGEQFLDVDVRLHLVLEIYTQPFAMLPPLAVEAPGNILMQALVDQLVPLLLQQLLHDYHQWVSQQLSPSTPP